MLCSAQKDFVSALLLSGFEIMLHWWCRRLYGTEMLPNTASYIRRPVKCVKRAADALCDFDVSEPADVDRCAQGTVKRQH